MIWYFHTGNLGIESERCKKNAANNELCHMKTDASEKPSTVIAAEIMEEVRSWFRISFQFLFALLSFTALIFSSFVIFTSLVTCLMEYRG